MRDHDRPDPRLETDLLSRRIDRIGLNEARLKPQHRDVLNDIRGSCPSCESPERCAAELAAASPELGWENWDEYCPNAAKLRILAALTMFPE